MALIVLDASVVIALTDADDDLHESAVEFLHEIGNAELRLPASAYAECLVGAARSQTLDLAREIIAGIGIGIVPIDEEIAIRSADVRAEVRSLRLPDALVLACGDTLEAELVVTADRRWRSFPRVRVLGAQLPR